MGHHVVSDSLLVADVGGTNARFSLVTAEGEFTHALKLKCAEFSEFVMLLQEYLERLDVARPTKACIAVAAPVIGDLVEFTNNPWSFSISAVKKALRIEHLHVVNDFEALAHSLSTLPSEELIAIGGDKIMLDGNKVVLGSGTGLGVAGLVAMGDDWRPVVGEGGYIDVAPKTQYERAVWQNLFTRYGRVSGERILSGPGLQELFRAINEVNDYDHKNYSPEIIVGNAVENVCSASRDTIDLFCSFLGDVAGSICLVFGARGGVYLGGGILLQILPLLKKSNFRKRFEDKGRISSYMKDIPTFVINDTTSALKGCISAFTVKNRGIT